MTTTTYYRIFHPQSTSYDPERFNSKEAAIEFATKKTYNGKGELLEYWTKQNNVVQKVTTIVEEVAVITPEQKQ